jgi:hypothetical protein
LEVSVSNEVVVVVGGRKKGREGSSVLSRVSPAEIKLLASDERFVGLGLLLYPP